MDGWLTDLRDTGAMLEGHFVLASGKHSDRYVLLPRLVAHPDRLKPWMVELSRHAAALEPTAIVGPAMGGVILAWALAEVLGPRVWAGFAEKEPDGSMAIRRGFPLGRSERVFLIEDVLTTGGSLMKTRDAVEVTGASVVGAGALVDRRPPGMLLPLPLATVTVLAAEAWDPDGCPLCAKGGRPTRPKLSS